jgi:peptidoglycan/LPS O-acetylase OafA/YrhL
MIAALFGTARRLAWPDDPGAFRLFLALVVFAHHLSSFDFGLYAVYVFFVLSGFWLHSMWVGRYSRTRRPYWTYLVSRVWRLAPVMVLVSAITIAFLLAIGVDASELFARPLHLAVSSVVLLGYAWLVEPPVGPAWSLDVEMQFYLVAPLLSALLLRGAARILLALAIALSAFLAWRTGVPVFPRYAVFFLVGMVAAQNGWRPSLRLARISALAVPVVLIAITLSPWRDVLWGGDDPGPLHRLNEPFNVAMAFVTVPFALHTVRRPSDRTDRALADLSYIVYLAHWAAIEWFVTFAGQPFGRRLAVAGASIVAVGAVSLLIWWAYDRPINRARALWVTKRAATPLPEAPSAAGWPGAEPAGP